MFYTATRSFQKCAVGLPSPNALNVVSQSHPIHAHEHQKAIPKNRQEEYPSPKKVYMPHGPSTTFNALSTAISNVTILLLK